jgi:acyl carrier protein
MLSTDQRIALQQLFIDQLACADKPFLPETRIVEDLGADSLDQIELLMAVEEVFGLELIEDDLARTLLTIGDIEAHIEREIADGWTMPEKTRGDREP